MSDKDYEPNIRIKLVIKQLPNGQLAAPVLMQQFKNRWVDGSTTENGSWDWGEWEYVTIEVIAMEKNDERY